MSDIMLHGVLNMPLADDPQKLQIVEWVQFRDRAQQASERILDLEAQLAQRDAALKAADELADALCAEEKTAGLDVWAKLDACEITDNALAAYRKARRQE